MARKRLSKNVKLAVIDFETDPFKFGRAPKPFASCFYSPEFGRVPFWGPDCATLLLAFLNAIEEPHLIYAHNGGRFDFYFLYQWLENPLLIIKSRIVEAQIGKHTLRDSFAIYPEALGSFEKTKIDYSRFEEEEREKHKVEIIDYMGDDCESLYKLVARFVADFGPKITIGTAALSELMKDHPQNFLRNSDKSPDVAIKHDERFRRFYYGGRVQAFEGGINRGKWKVFDVNSMYPGVMKRFNHPGSHFYVNPANITIERDGNLRGFPNAVWFIDFEGAATHLPYKERDGTLSFEHRVGRFTVPCHEFKVAYSAGFVRVDRINEILVCTQAQSFGKFVDRFTAKKIEAEEAGDKLGRSFYKRINNSAYGKFATNPREFKDYHIETLGEWNHPPINEGWEVVENNGVYRLWARKAGIDDGWKDVAIAASITSAARAVLLKALLSATRPGYCDTDSIICEDLNGVEFHPTELGAWKTEARGDELCVAGKKLYALFQKGSPVKYASKGAVLTPAQIRRIATGEKIDYFRDAPSYDVAGNAKFITREIRQTLDRPAKSRQNSNTRQSGRVKP